MSKSSSENKVRSYLESLTKADLIALILKFAPQSFIANINSQTASKQDALTIFDAASEEIDEIFSDEDLLYNPGKFERKLLKQLEGIIGLWDKLPSQVGMLILKIIEDVEQAFEDGYLYIEKYGEEDDYFESEAINDYVFRFSMSLPAEMKADYIESLNELLGESGHSTFLSLERRLPTVR